MELIKSTNLKEVRDEAAQREALIKELQDRNKMLEEQNANTMIAMTELFEEVLKLKSLIETPK